MTNPLVLLGDQGQSVWLDYLDQKILQDGELERLIVKDHVKGLTSNPSIFEKAIGSGQAYTGRLRAAIAAGDAGVMTLYERLAIGDIQTAADLFRPVYDRLQGLDGYVSLEVSPYLAMDGPATIAEARRLWGAVDRPNLMIKVPGTKAGALATRQLIGEGINVNVTLLFAVEAYIDVAEAYVAGLEALKAAGGDVSRTHSVASFFLSRIDVAIDKQLALRQAGQSEKLDRLRGKAALASAKLAYESYLALIDTPRWKALSGLGAAPQRLLWASTGAKDPSYSDVMYVSELIGRDTINTMPPKTMAAFRDHGAVRASLTEDVASAHAALCEIARAGVDMSQVTSDLVVEGVALFARAFDDLLGAVADQRRAILGERLNSQTLTAGASLINTQRAVLKRAALEGWTRRLWAKDGSWAGNDENARLGWLNAGLGQAVDLTALAALQHYVRAGGFTHALLMGAGGASVGPGVFAQSFASVDGFPRLVLLESTDPTEITRVEAGLNLTRTLYVLSSKSGSNLETVLWRDYFSARAAQAAGGKGDLEHWIAITDPGSSLDALARSENFGHVFYGEGDGERYSVLSNFGLVPAAIAGLDVGAFLDKTAFMARACGPDAPPSANPGFTLGALLGAAARAGRNKVTIFAPAPMASFGAWLEHLLGPSRGKHAQGPFPVCEEKIAPPEAYGEDRVFVSFELGGDGEPVRAAALAALEAAGHPSVRIRVTDNAALGQEFFRWEVAATVASAASSDLHLAGVVEHALTDKSRD